MIGVELDHRFSFLVPANQSWRRWCASENHLCFLIDRCFFFVCCWWFGGWCFGWNGLLWYWRWYNYYECWLVLCSQDKRKFFSELPLARCNSLVMCRTFLGVGGGLPRNLLLGVDGGEGRFSLLSLSEWSLSSDAAGVRYRGANYCLCEHTCLRIGYIETYIRL